MEERLKIATHAHFFLLEQRSAPFYMSSGCSGIRISGLGLGIGKGCAEGFDASEDGRRSLSQRCDFYMRHKVLRLSVCLGFLAGISNHAHLAHLLAYPQ